MASRKNKRASGPKLRAPRTAIVPQVVFRTVVAASVVPVMGLAAVGCDRGVSPAVDAGVFSVAMAVDAGRDAGNDASFSVAMAVDGGTDAGTFSVAVPVDAGTDAGVFAVAVPLDGAFSVVIAPLDASASS